MGEGNSGEISHSEAAGTWEVVNAPESVNIVGSKRVFRIKKDTAGNVVRYQARRIAQGFSHQQKRRTNISLKKPGINDNSCEVYIEIDSIDIRRYSIIIYSSPELQSMIATTIVWCIHFVYNVLNS